MKSMYIATIDHVNLLKTAYAPKTLTGAGDLDFSSVSDKGPSYRNSSSSRSVSLEELLNKPEVKTFDRVIRGDVALGAVLKFRKTLAEEQGLTFESFTTLAKEVFGLPSFMGPLLFARIDKTYNNLNLSWVLHYLDNNAAGRSVRAHMFDLVATENGEFITTQDLLDLLKAVSAWQGGQVLGEEELKAMAVGIHSKLTLEGTMPADLEAFSAGHTIVKLIGGLETVDLKDLSSMLQGQEKANKQQQLPLVFIVPPVPQAVLSYLGDHGQFVPVYEGEPAHLMWIEYQAQQERERELYFLHQRREQALRQIAAQRQKQEHEAALWRLQLRLQQQQQGSVPSTEAVDQAQASPEPPPVST